MCKLYGPLSCRWVCNKVNWIEYSYIGRHDRLRVTITASVTRSLISQYLSPALKISLVTLTSCPTLPWDDVSAETRLKLHQETRLRLRLRWDTSQAQLRHVSAELETTTVKPAPGGHARQQGLPACWSDFDMNGYNPSKLSRILLLWVISMFELVVKINIASWCSVRPVYTIPIVIYSIR